MKRIFALFIATILLTLAVIPCFGEGEELPAPPVTDTSEDTVTDTEENVTDAMEGGGADDFNILMTELYEYWQRYTATEGDNAFEKAVNFAWKYRGDIGGVAAAIAVTVLLLVMAFRFMPTLKRYFDYIYKGNQNTKTEIMEEVKKELSAYAPALSTVERVADLYPAFKELVDKLVGENNELKQLITEIGKRVASTENRHAAEMKLQGETFRDIITLSALPAGKKAEILDSYRAIMAEADKARDDTAPEGAEI